MTRKNRECITFCFGFSETCAAQKRLKTLRNPPGKGRTLRHPSIRVPPQSRRRPGELAVAQLVEHPAVVRAVGGSSPSFQTFLVYHFAACCEKVAAGEWGRGNGSRLPRIRYLAGSRGRPFFPALAPLARKEFGWRRRWRARGAAGGWEHGLCVLCAADTLAVSQDRCRPVRQLSLLGGPIFGLSGSRWRTHNLGPQVTRVGPRAGAGWVANAFWVRMTPCAFAQNCSNARALNHSSGRVCGSLTE